MEVLNQIHMVPNLTALTKITILNINFSLFCLIKRYDVNKMFPLEKRDIREWDSRYEPQNN